MISRFVTVITTSKNSLHEIKALIESTASQFKISNTKIFILDFGSTDGTIQYIDGLNNGGHNIISVDVINMLEGEKNIEEYITTPYVLLMSPGALPKSKDFFFNVINSINNAKIQIYPYDNKIAKKIFSNYYARKNQLKMCIFSNKEILQYINYSETHPNGFTINSQKLKLYRFNKNKIKKYAR